MSMQTSKGLAYDPQDLERLLVSRQNAGDVNGMAALYEPDALLDDGEGRLVRGREAIRQFFAELVAQGRKFQMGQQRPAMICGGFGAQLNAVPEWHRNRRSGSPAKRRHLALGH